MKFVHRLHIAAVVFLLAAAPLSANWTEVRELIRKSDGLTDREKREEILRTAYAMAQSSVAKSPRESNEFLWLANAAGRLAAHAGMKEKLLLAKVVKENAERAIALDPKNGGAYMTLGAWQFYVANISWIQRNAAKALFGALPEASYQKAVEMLTSALKLGVENTMEVYFLRGRAHEELDREESAHADFRRCLAATPKNAKERNMQKEARERLGS